GIAGMAFPTSISLLPARSVDPDVTARLSGFVQPVGYILAGVGPLVIGALYTASNSWTTSLLVLLTLTLLMAIAGALSSRNINVDDQLELISASSSVAMACDCSPSWVCQVTST